MTEQQEGSQSRILIIDSGEDVTVPLESHFRQRGVTVLIASTMDAGLELALRQRPDIVLLAATLGGVDGLEVFRRLRRAPLTAHIPVMFIADFQDTRRQNQLLAEGADDVIARPFDVEILALRMRNAMQRSRREGLIDAVTGLPAAALIEEKRRELGQQAGWVELTVTLLHFDSFRARYDFITGNEVLRYAANELSRIVTEVEGAEGFVGYSGETHYTLFVSAGRVEAVIRAIQAQVGEGLLQFYTFMEREQGFVQLEDGQGGLEERPLLRVQIERVERA